MKKRYEKIALTLVMLCEDDVICASADHSGLLALVHTTRLTGGYDFHVR